MFWAGRLSSDLRDLGVRDHFLPLGDIRLYVGRKLRRRHSIRFEADRQQLVLHVGQLDDACDFRLQQIDDRCGVPAGSSTPCIVSAAWFLIPSSSSVGTSGKAGERVAAVTASARNLPSFTSEVAGGIAWKHIGVCPATTDWIDGAPPGNGASAKSSPKVSLNSSLERCGVVPIPGEAKVYFPGLALISSTNSFTDLAGMLGFTNRPLGEPAALVTGAKSLSGS